jgi:hypothetical protein
MLLFAAATQGYFLVRSRSYESVALLLVAFTLFRPGFWMDMISPPFHDVPPAKVVAEIAKAAPGAELRLQVAGEDEFGKPKTFFVPLTVPQGKDAAERLTAIGIEVLDKDGELLVDNVAFGSDAQKAGLKLDQKILNAHVGADQPPKQLMWPLGFIVLALVVWLQRRRATAARGLASA